MTDILSLLRSGTRKTGGASPRSTNAIITLPPETEGVDRDNYRPQRTGTRDYEVDIAAPTPNGEISGFASEKHLTFRDVTDANNMDLKMYKPGAPNQGDEGPADATGKYFTIEKGLELSGQSVLPTTYWGHHISDQDAVTQPDLELPPMVEAIRRMFERGTR